MHRPSRVTIRDGRRLFRDGRPIFPIGLYYSEDEQADTTGRGLAELRRIGFDTLFFNGGIDARPTLDRIAAAGFQVQWRPPGSLNSGFDALETLVAAVRDHPAILFWEVEDEPVLNGVSLDDTRKGIARLRRLDPNHPILCVQYPDASQTDALKAWAAATDIIGFDFYPVPLDKWYYQHRNLPVPHTLGAPGKIISWFRALAPDRPVLPVLQAWAWKPVQDGRAGYPTPEQSRYLAYHAVVRGACGLLYYGKRSASAPHTASGIPESLDPDPDRLARDFATARRHNAAFWETFEPLVQELAALRSVFAAPDWKGPLTVDAPADVEWAARDTRGGPVVLVVHGGAAPAEVRVTCRAFAGRRVNVRHEERTIVADRAGAFTDTLPPLGVRVYAR